MDGKEFVGKKLKPGLYIGARRVPGVGNFRHQFMVLIPKDAERFRGKVRDLGNGNLGIVVGAYVQQGVLKNILGMGTLTYHRNSPKDRSRLKKYLRGEPDEDAVLFRSANKGLPIDDTIDEVLARGRSYRSSARKHAVAYPSLIKNMLGWGKNSNSFIQSLADTSGIRKRKKNLPGIDPGASLRLPSELFSIKEGSMQLVGYLDGYIGKEAKPITDAVVDVSEKTWKGLDKHRKIPLEILGQSKLMADTAPAGEIRGSVRMNQRRIPIIQMLIRLKKESDRRNYTDKHRIATELIRKNPDDFMIDSAERGVVGVTHRPSGFRFHLPREVAYSLFDKTAAGGLEFTDYLESVGKTPEEYKRDSYIECDLIKQPEEDPIDIRPSEIEGKGTFVTKPVAAGDQFALGFDDNLRRTTASRYINHSANPNTAFTPAPDGMYLTALTDLKAGTELTVDYGNMFRHDKEASDHEWIGVDLDGTLAKYSGWKGPDVIGSPIPAMVDRVKRAIGRGKNVKIFTARVAGDNDGVARRAVKKWCQENLGMTLPVTCVKDQHCRQIWDDIAKKVYKNTGSFNKRASVLAKLACGDMIQYFHDNPGKYEEWKERQKAKKAKKQKEAKLNIKGTPVQPTSPEQADAGTYKKGHTRMHGMGITIEQLKGQYRKGTSPDGTEWKTKMKHHYGYIKRTKSGADGDHVDVFIGPDVDSEMVFVVNQTNKGGKGFDEHKCMLGFTNEKDARKGYLDNYEKGWDGLGSITALTIDQFKKWVYKGDTSKALKPLQKVGKSEYAYSLLEGRMKIDRRAAIAHSLIKIAKGMENVKELPRLGRRELTRAVRDAIIKEQEAIKHYETVADSTENRRASHILQDISDEGKVHVDELEGLLKELDPQDEDFREEAEEMKEASQQYSPLVQRTLALIGRA